MRLLSGMPINVGNFSVRPLTLREILDIGEDVYSELLSAVMADKTSLKSDVDLDESVTNYMIVYTLALQDEVYRRLVLNSLALFLSEEIFMDSYGFYSLRDQESVYMTSDEFMKIQEIIKIQNYLGESEEDSGYKPANDKAKEYAEKLAKLRGEMVEDNNKEEGLRLGDLVSIVSVYSYDINILSVWSLTIYQLHECYIRLIVRDDYDKHYMHLPYVEDEDRDKVEHWSRPVSIDNLRRS